MRATDRLMEAMLKSSVGTQTLADLDAACLRHRTELRQRLAEVEAEIRALDEGAQLKAVHESQKRIERLERQLDEAKREHSQALWTYDRERDRLRNERHQLKQDVEAQVPVSVQILVEDIDQSLASISHGADGRRRAEILHQLRAKAFELGDVDPTDIAVRAIALRQEMQRA